MKKTKALIISIINVMIVDLIYYPFFWDGKEILGNILVSLLFMILFFCFYYLFFLYEELKEKYKKYIGD